MSGILQEAHQPIRAGMHRLLFPRHGELYRGCGRAWNRQSSKFGTPLGKCANTPQSCMMLLGKEKGFPPAWSLLCSFLLGLLGFGMASSDAGPRGACASELPADQQQAKADTSFMDCQCMRFLINFLVRNVWLVCFFRFSKFWFESKRSGQRTPNSPRGRYLGSP